MYRNISLDIDENDYKTTRDFCCVSKCIGHIVILVLQNQTKQKPILVQRQETNTTITITWRHQVVWQTQNQHQSQAQINIPVWPQGVAHRRTGNSKQWLIQNLTSPSSGSIYCPWTWSSCGPHSPQTRGPPHDGEGRTPQSPHMYPTCGEIHP